MRLHAVFPQTEIGSDPAVIARFIRDVEAMGFDGLVAYDHVLGADPARPGWSGPYTIESQFHEVMVLFSFAAAITTRLELSTGVLILPQRQTALVAKQAAALDVLSGGRLRLGVGVGWNWVEFEALGMSFKDRGKRIEEQIALLRRLWTERSVTLDGGWHHVDRAGINPLPVRRPIPLWMGADTEVALRRVARRGRASTSSSSALVLRDRSRRATSWRTGRRCCASNHAAVPTSSASTRSGRTPRTASRAPRCTTR